ncbi:Wzz/FepE/Etk N-terminal domain-containing protein [Edwardsiella sp. A.80236]|uniref:Wzz/FepE/Etk N-terminal domain-containing protein n=1 Tax=Edwardsiella sp. A.80236 TaxID=3318355 RepID=UPI0037C64A6E
MSSDEIDLLALLMVLFKAKWLIVGAVVACALLGLVAKTLLPQKWTSYAELVPAQARELSSMHKELNQLALLDIQVDASPAWLMSRFVQIYDSQIARREYILQSDYYRQLTASMQDAQEKERVLSALAEQAFSLSTPKDKGMEDLRLLSPGCYDAQRAGIAYFPARLYRLCRQTR